MLVFTDNIRRLVLWSIIVGGGLCLVYDIMRVLRNVFGICTDVREMRGKRGFFIKTAYLFFLDFVFCLMVAICLLLLSYYLNGGLFRGLTLLCMAMGFIFTRLTASRLFYFVLFRIALAIKWVLLKVFSLLCKIAKKIGRPLFCLYHLTLGKIICIIKDRVKKKREFRRMKKSILQNAGKEENVEDKGSFESHYKKERIVIGRRAEDIRGGNG